METTVPNLEKLVQDQGFASLHEFAKIRLTVWLKTHLDLCMLAWEKQQFEKIVDQLQPEISFPFQDTLVNRAQKMSLDEKNTIERVIEHFGYSLQAYVQKEFLRYCQERLYYSIDLAHYFEQKYGLENPEQLTKQFTHFEFEDLEKERDHWAWEEASESIYYCQTLLNELASC